MTLGVDLWSCIHKALPRDTLYHEMRGEIELGRVFEGHFSRYYLESNQILLNLGHIYVSLMDDLHTLILIEAHHAPYSTHPDVKKIHANLK